MATTQQKIYPASLWQCWKLVPLKLRTLMIVLGLTLTIVVFRDEQANADPRLGPPACEKVVVEKGDTAWDIATGRDITVDKLAELNEHIPDMRLIYPGDEIVVSCPQPTPTPTLATPVASPETVENPVVPQMVKVEDPFAKWRHGQEPCVINGVQRTCWTWKAVLVSLHDAGFRGNDLITMASIAPCESGRAVDATGDTEPKYVNGLWGPSIGVFQIRSVDAEEGKGSLRDGSRLYDLDFNSNSAFGLYTSAIDKSNRKWIHTVTKKVWTRFDDWTCYMNGSYKKSIDTARWVATEIGVV